MKVKDLVNGCQNQWKGFFEQNSMFKIVFHFEDCENVETWTIDEFNYYHCNGVENSFIFNQINKRHNQEVLCWEMVDMNTIYIKVRYF